MKPEKILLFTRGLDVGGAERQLVLLAKSLHQRGLPVAVMVYYGDGPFRIELDRLGIAVIDLKKSGRWDFIGFALRTTMAIRKYKPNVIYTFIGAHLVSSILWSLIGRPAVIWGVRASYKDVSKFDTFTRYLHFLSIWTSRFADAIICNSQAGRDYILSIGYRNSKIQVIPNGIDTNIFLLSQEKRHLRRISLNISENALVIGIVARIDYVKDHSCFLNACAIVSKSIPGLRFVCIGDGDSELLSKLKIESQELNLTESLVWAGHSSDSVADYSAMDILVSSSMTEGFPNVIVEGMACGLPVVATNVGDCRQIVEDCGWIVPPKDPQALAQAILEAIEALPNWQHERSRQRVIENFSVDAMVDRTLAVLQSVVKS